MRILHVGDDFAELRPCGLTLYSDAVMRAQAASGHEVAYVFSGRHYPRLRQPRLKRWRLGSIQMYELVGPPNQSHWESGTLHPGRDLEEHAGEVTFRTAVRETRPDLVHVQELARLPSSLIEHAKAAGIPVVMTLHDYQPLCASVRLLDADGRRCLKHEIGDDCARNCASAPEGVAHLVDLTMRYERARIKRAVPLAERVRFEALGPVLRLVDRALAAPETGAGPTGRGATASPAAYQRRRDVNVRRLQLCDRLIAPSARVAAIYAQLGVDESRLTVQRLTLPHLENLKPRRGTDIHDPVRFITLGGCASYSKGSAAVVQAVRRLEEAGLGGQYQLLVLGQVELSVADSLAHVSSVSLGGSYKPGELDRILDEPDVGVLPSVWEEAHGFVGVEMLAKGLPVIGNVLGGVPEYVRPRLTGWLTSSPDGAGLAEMMRHLIEHPDEIRRLRASVRSYREQLVRPMREHLEELDSLYRALAGPTSANRRLSGAPTS